MRLLKHKKVMLAWRLPNLCNVSSRGNNQIKLTYFDETKKRVLNTVRAKETYFSKRQSSMKVLGLSRHLVGGLTDHCAIKERTVAINHDWVYTLPGIQIDCRIISIIYPKFSSSAPKAHR